MACNVHIAQHDCGNITASALLMISINISTKSVTVSKAVLLLTGECYSKHLLLKTPDEPTSCCPLAVPVQLGGEALLQQELGKIQKVL